MLQRNISRHSRHLTARPSLPRGNDCLGRSYHHRAYALGSSLSLCLRIVIYQVLLFYSAMAIRFDVMPLERPHLMHQSDQKKVSCWVRRANKVTSTRLYFLSTLIDESTFLSIQMTNDICPSSMNNIIQIHNADRSIHSTLLSQHNRQA